MPPVPRLIHASELWEALRAAGIINEEDRARRVVIDIEVGNVPKVYIERFMDSRVLEVLQRLEGVEVRFTDSPAK